MTRPGLAPRPDAIDTGLLILFLVGIYLNLSINLAQGVPVPTAIAGPAGLALLLKNAGRIETRHLVALLTVILLFLASILCAADYRFLFERFKGFVQLSYSLMIGYGVFITILKYDRDRIARIFLSFCVLIVIGCALENYAGLRPVSDAFRKAVFETGVYRSDIRDQALYGMIRPKLFTSEPSAVTFSFTLYAFAWLVLSTWRLKLFGYLGLLAAGFVLMRGPTLLLGFLLAVPYEIFLAARKDFGGGYDIRRLCITLVAAALLLVAFYAVGTTFYAERIDNIERGSDPSFYSRVVGPALVAAEVVRDHPIAGAGITGEEFIEHIVLQVYATSPDLPTQWSYNRVSEVLTNYFWLHWLYLGMIWGLVMLAALAWYMRVLGAPSLAFCGIVWAIVGQASGAYVAPRVWLVLYLSCAVAVLHQRQSAWAPRRAAPLRGMPARAAPLFRPTMSAP